jgi:FkbM family methyltransferase
LALRRLRGPADNAGRMFTRFRYLYRAYRYRLRVDPAELRFVGERLRLGHVAVDIGCHKGAYTYWMRRRVGPGGAVYAFEPQPRQVAYLREAFSAMRYDNVVVVPMAVSDKCGEMLLRVSADAGRTHEASLERGAGCREQGGSSSSSNSLLSAPCSTLSVNVTTLDDFFAERPHGPNFLKIDVEGHELEVLEGARRTLETHRPTILVECEARHRPGGDVRPVFELLHSLGYEGSFFVNRTRRPLAEFDQAVHQRLDPASPQRLPRGYVNNFAFEPPT